MFSILLISLLSTWSQSIIYKDPIIVLGWGFRLRWRTWVKFWKFFNLLKFNRIVPKLFIDRNTNSSNIFHKIFYVNLRKFSWKSFNVEERTIYSYWRLWLCDWLLSLRSYTTEISPGEAAAEPSLHYWLLVIHHHYPPPPPPLITLEGLLSC